MEREGEGRKRRLKGRKENVGGRELDACLVLQK
jgi:hypothetical protein